MHPVHIFMLNLMYEWMILLLLRPFYEPHLRKLAMSTSDSQDTARSLSKDNEDLKKIYRLANEECPKSAGRVLDLFQAYEKLFTLRLTPLTTVQIAYHAGKTLMRTVSAGSHGGPKAVQAGLKAREKLRECVKQLRSIGETWIGGLVTAEMLEKDLDAEIERQTKASMISSRSPKNSNALVPAAPNTVATKATRTATASSPKAIPIVSPRFVLPNDYLGAANTVGPSSGNLDDLPEGPNKKRRSSPSILAPGPKRAVPRSRNEETRHHNLVSQGLYERPGNILFLTDLHAASYSHTVFPIEQTYSQISVMPMDSNFDYLMVEHSPILPIGTPTSPQAYYAPPPHPPPSRLLHQHTSANNRLPVPVDPLTGFEIQTSMNQWLPSGFTFSGAPSSELPALPFPVLPFSGEPDTDDVTGEN